MFPHVLALIGSLLAAPAAEAQRQQPRPTAVFIYDTVHATLFVKEMQEFRDRFYGWAEKCETSAEEDQPQLSCPPAPAGADEEGVITEVDAAVALFRDLDRVIYIAACPDIPKTEAQRALRPGRGEKKTPSLAESVVSKEWQTCLQIAAGQTFSAEMEEQQTRIVFRGESLPLRLIAIHRPPRRIPTPYQLEPSEPLPPVPLSRGVPPPPPLEGPAPEFTPPDVERASEGRPTASSAHRNPARGVSPAHTGLATGRLIVECSSSRVRLYLDDAYIGACPMVINLLAGPHAVRAERPGREAFESELRVTAGQTTRVTIPR